MCGFCGIWNYRERLPVERSLLEQMNRTLVLRGPDDEGFFFDDEQGLGLGFRRLAIIDLSPAAHQPMTNEDGSVWIAFNGEVYNFLTLRPQLEKQGHRFRSQSDTEVLLHLYEEVGENLPASLHGMFAIALWDTKSAADVL
jgi:asparagine synthase (glutamine-hydrolysing)